MGKFTFASFQEVGLTGLSRWLSQYRIRPHPHAGELQEHFGDQIIITETNGKPNVVTFRSTVANILHDFHAQPKSVDLETEKLNIIRTASRLIKSDIKLIKTSYDIYPLIETGAETNANFLPHTLKLLLEGILVGKDDVKIASIGQAISIQAARPRVILAPLQVGLTVQLHHHFTSPWCKVVCQDWKRHCAGRSTTPISATYCYLLQVRWLAGFVLLRTVQLTRDFVRFSSDAEAAAKTSSCWCYMGKTVI